ncbi:MAG: hypothetical protein QOJ84_4576 [Bradyrhizobium sp.]|nr:hypothetical protein [Bradyrhizobium sp.]
MHGRGQPQQPGGFLRTEIIGSQLSSRTTRPEFVAGDGLTLADIAMGNQSTAGTHFRRAARFQKSQNVVRSDFTAARLSSSHQETGGLKRPNVRLAVPKWS